MTYKIRKFYTEGFYIGLGFDTTTCVPYELGGSYKDSDGVYLVTKIEVL